MAGHPEICQAMTVAGDSDVILLVRTRDTQHLEDLLVALGQSPSVERTRAQVILSGSSIAAGSCYRRTSPVASATCASQSALLSMVSS
jgi:hypothetical protein